MLLHLVSPAQARNGGLELLQKLPRPLQAEAVNEVLLKLDLDARAKTVSPVRRPGGHTQDVIIGRKRVRGGVGMLGSDYGRPVHRALHALQDDQQFRYRGVVNHGRFMIVAADVTRLMVAIIAEAVIHVVNGEVPVYVPETIYGWLAEQIG